MDTDTLTNSDGDAKTLPHLVLVAMASAVGHARPFCVMAARMVKLRPVVVTLFTTAWSHDRVSGELARNFDASEHEAQARLRVVAVPSEEGRYLDVEALLAGFEAAYQELVAGRPVTCANTGMPFPGIASPSTVVLDVFASKALTAVRTYSRKPVKTYCWVACSAAGYHQHFGIASPNKKKDVYAFIQQETTRTGKSAEEVALEVFFRNAKGDVVSIPGLPPMFDYEEHPQALVMEEQLIGSFRMGAAEVTDTCDGMLIATPHAFETPETLRSLSQYYGGEVYAIGPLLPTAADANSLERSRSKDTDEIDALMTRALETHGPQSLVYISFGSTFWSTEPDKIWAFLDVLMERKLPFILAHASPFATVPAEIQEKVKQYGLGLLSPWSPQQYILSHPVVGWFVTHCGFNGLLESLNAGVPMICWPFTVDQPANALHTVANLGVAYELFEVRTGTSCSRRGRARTRGSRCFAPTGTLDAVRAAARRVLELAYGADGAQKRARAQVLSGQFAKAWDETDEGVARIALQRFLDQV